jgi:hypothetical protein
MNHMKISFLIFIVVLSVSCARKEREQKESAVSTVAVANDLPAFQIKLLDGKIIDGKHFATPAALVLFQPDCDHCQREATQIQTNLPAFKHYTLYFVSSAPEPGIQKFSEEYKLAGKENVLFGWTTTENIINTFGPIDAPSVYLYSREGKLVQSFNGEVDISVILKYL